MEKKIKFINCLFSILFIIIALTFSLNILTLFLLKVSILTLIFLLIGTNLIYYHNKAIKILPTNKLEVKTKQTGILFYIFLIISLFIISLILVLGQSIPNPYKKIVIMSLCVSLFCSLFCGYRLEYYNFYGKNIFSENRPLGLAINPHHPLGKVIYFLIFLLIIFIFIISIFIGPTQ